VIFGQGFLPLALDKLISNCRAAEEKTTMVWPRQEDARGENTEINFGMGTSGETKKRTS
jgi:hypothetical protein